MARIRLVAGNWKMHGSRSANRALVDAILKRLPRGAECAICPPFPYLAEVAEQLRGTSVALGAQNVSEHAQGAHTGEVSAGMLKELGCRYVIVGHSERRQIYGETDAQLGAVQFADGVLAYEPVWAIGTGRNATPEQAQAVHAFLRRRLREDATILYGGSVKAQNAAAIFAMPDVDGGLIGGASLVAEDFLAILQAAGIEAKAGSKKVN